MRLARLLTLLLVICAPLALAATPASAAAVADPPALTLVGQGLCQESSGQAVVLWQLSQNSGYVGTFVGSQASPPGSTLSGFDYKIFASASGPISGSQQVPSGTTSASLTLQVEFALPEGPVTVSVSASVAVPPCAILQPSVAFAKQCDGTMTVTVVHPASATNTVIVWVYGIKEQGELWLAEGPRLSPSQQLNTTLPAYAAYGAKVVLNQQTEIASTGPMPLPAGCPGATAPNQPGGGQPGATQPNPGQPTGGATTTDSPTSPTTGNSPAATATGASAGTGSLAAHPTTTTATVDVRLAGLSQPAIAAASTGLLAAIALAAAILLFARRRRISTAAATTSSAAAVADAPDESSESATPSADGDRNGSADPSPSI